MRASRPEARSEYSSSSLRRSPAAPLLCLLGAALLVAAELTPLLKVRVGPHQTLRSTLTTGAHDSYALLPVAALAAALALAAWRSRSRVAFAGIAAMGAVALGIALLSDLPDAHASGLVGSPARGLYAAASRPRIGLYLEVGGALVVLLGAAVGLLLDGRTPVAGARRGRTPVRSAS
jgi:hypothetical protein